VTTTTSERTSRQQLLTAATAAVLQVMPIARLLGSTLKAVPPIEKPDGSPVTAADYVVQALVVAALRDRLPEGRVPLMGEEHADSLAACGRPDAERLVIDAIRSTLGWRDRAAALRAIDGDVLRAGEPFWTIDPIDGTKGFIVDAHFSVCLARIEGSRATVGVLGCPRMGAAGDLSLRSDGPGAAYAAAEGCGAWEFVPGTDGPRAARAARWDGGTIRWARSLNRSATKIPSRTEPAVTALAPAVESFRMDSQCKYALVARGDSDLVVRMPRGGGSSENIWDHASGAVIAAEAGAVVTDVCGRPLDFGCGESLERNAGILCAAAGLHARAVEALAPIARGTASQAEA
jgi:3'(2'), 5'-bisphosphate nucleotidase